MNKMFSQNIYLLLFMLLSYNIDFELFKAIHCLYNESRSCIKINYMFNEYFDVKFVVKQGDLLSPLLFNLFIIDSWNNKHCEVKAGIDNVSILLYADDIIYVTYSQHLNCSHEWCMEYINASKSNVINFRKKIIAR